MRIIRENPRLRVFLCQKKINNFSCAGMPNMIMMGRRFIMMIMI